MKPAESRYDGNWRQLSNSKQDLLILLGTCAFKHVEILRKGIVESENQFNHQFVLEVN